MQATLTHKFLHSINLGGALIRSLIVTLGDLGCVYQRLTHHTIEALGIAQNLSKEHDRAIKINFILTKTFAEVKYLNNFGIFVYLVFFSL